MILKGIYINSGSISRTRYDDCHRHAVFYRSGGSEQYIDCTRQEYEETIMRLQREMERGYAE